jgi:hypothetical protein
MAGGPEAPSALVDDSVPASRRPRIDADDLHDDTLSSASDDPASRNRIDLFIVYKSCCGAEHAGQRERTVVMFERIRELLRRKPSAEPAATAEAATVLAMGTQSGIAAVPGAAVGTATPEPAQDEPNPDSEGAI